MSNPQQGSISFLHANGARYPYVRDYTLNHTWDPNMRSSMVLSEGTSLSGLFSLRNQNDVREKLVRSA